MIWVLLQSESPWQRNDAITFLIYLCGRFPFTQNFRNFRFGGKLNTFRVSKSYHFHKKLANCVDSMLFHCLYDV